MIPLTSALLPRCRLAGDLPEDILGFGASGENRVSAVGVSAIRVAVADVVTAHVVGVAVSVTGVPCVARIAGGGVIIAVIGVVAAGRGRYCE